MNRLTKQDAYWMGEEFWTSAEEPDDDEIDKVYMRLKAYEDTGLTPEEVEELHNFEKTNSYRLLKKLNAEERKNGWISVEEQLPEDDVMVLVTVSGIYNALTFVDAIQIGAHDREGWFIDGYEKWDNPNVTVWMPLPEPYTPAPEQNKPSGWQEQMMGAFLGDSRL